MSTVCNCNTTFSNTGKPGCDTIQQVTKGIIVVPTFDSTGARNYIDPADTLDAAFWAAAINNADSTLRYFPIQNIKNITTDRADPTYENFEDQSKTFIHQGLRTFTGILPIQSTSYLAKLEAGKCTSISVYLIDKDGNLIGKQMNDDGFLYPIEVNEQTWYAKYIPGTDTTKSKIQLSFDYGVNEQDSDISMILASSFTDLSLLNLTGLIDVYATVSGVTATGFTLHLRTDFGPIGNKIFAKGFAIANFISSSTGATSKIRRTNNTPADVAITSVTATETATDYYYTVVIPTATTGDTLQLKLSKSGYDASQVVNVITIP